MATSLIGSSGFRSKPPKGYDFANIPQMSPESMDLWRNLIQRSGGGALSGTDLLSRIAAGDESAFEGLEKPYYNAFNKMSGDIASRFSGAGMGARGSSAFRNAISGAAGELSDKLGSQRLGLQLGASERLQDLARALLSQQPYETGLVQKQPSGWQQLFGSLGQGLGLGIGGLPGMFKWGF